MDLSCRIQNDEVMIALSQCMGSIQTMKTLSVRISENSQITSVGWQTFAAMLQIHTCMEEIKVETYGSLRLGQYALGLLFDALRVNCTLLRVHIPISTIREFQTLASILENRSCLLEELHVIFNNPGDNENQDYQLRESIELNHILARALRSNSSLKVLEVQNYNDHNFEFDLDLFSDVIHDKSSIGAACNSNHTLETLSISLDLPPPIELHSILHQNRDTNKHAVARKKILQSHTFEEVNFVPESLPTVMAWIGNTDSSKALAQMYSILRKVPHAIQKSNENHKIASA
jgi:hypothetical protein